MIGWGRQLQAVSRKPCAGDHRKGDDQRPSAKDVAEEFHGSGPAHDFGAGIAVCHGTDQGAGSQCESGAGDEGKEGHGSCSDAFTIAPALPSADPPKE